ncbi:dihydroneopterin aldolase [Bacillus fonticola]|uniref:dihydroneopterin aldolase n=1 Tax=Bacillus fonticola TaxID=2728853 RepID=UPI001475B16C|nr:dihydroneopterin aldolase [Bacillus fonticola]
MDCIRMKEMEFYGYHGVFPEETKLGQRFRMNVTLQLSLQKAGKLDDLQYSVNYGDVYNLCKEVVEGTPVKLVETLAERTTAVIFQQFTHVQAVTVEVIKPDPPIPGHYKEVSVEVTRERTAYE